MLKEKFIRDSIQISFHFQLKHCDKHIWIFSAHISSRGRILLCPGNKTFPIWEDPGNYKKILTLILSKHLQWERKNFTFLCHRILTWSRSSRQHMNISKMSTDTAKVNYIKNKNISIFEMYQRWTYKQFNFILILLILLLVLITILDLLILILILI